MEGIIDDKMLKVVIEVVKIGVYKEIDINKELLNEVFTNSLPFPIVNGHLNVNDRPYEATKNKGMLISLKDDVLIAEITLDLQSELGIGYLNGSLFNWSAVIEYVNGKLMITELGLLGNVPPAIQGLRELSRITFSVKEDDILNKKEVNVMEDLKVMFETLTASVSELAARVKVIEEAEVAPVIDEVPIVEESTDDDVVAIDGKIIDEEMVKEMDMLRAENEMLKAKIDAYESEYIDNVIVEASGKDTVKREKLVELSAKYKGDIKGFESIVKGIVVIPEREVLIVQPKKVVKNLNIGSGALSLKNM